MVYEVAACIAATSAVYYCSIVKIIDVIWRNQTLLIM